MSELISAVEDPWKAHEESVWPNSYRPLQLPGAFVSHLRGVVRCHMTCKDLDLLVPDRSQALNDDHRSLGSR